MFSKFRGWWERGRKYPNESWLTAANEEGRHSPDLWDLERSPIQLLFLPCELQEEHTKGALSAEGGLCLFKAFTINKFSLLRNREDNSAIFLDEPRFRIKGEVWAMCSQHYSILDNYKENGVRCTRKHVDVIVPYSRVTKSDAASEVRRTMSKLSAWVYEGRPEFWEDKLDGGFQYPPVSVYRPNNPFLHPFQYFHINDNKK